MASTGSLFSQTLQEITNTKLDELAKKRTAFEEHRARITTAAEGETDDVEMLGILANGVKELFSIQTSSSGHVIRGTTNNPRLEIDLKNLDRFIGQARYDPSVSPKVLGQWQKSLLRHLEIQSLKYSYASLYGQLTTEWLSFKQPTAQASGEDEEMEDYQHVSSGKKLESRLKWERSVFEPVDVDVDAIKKLLGDLFEAKQGSNSKGLLKALGNLRKKVKAFEQDLAKPIQFTIASLTWVMNGLQNSDLLTDEKRAVLKDFVSNDIILGEIADVLNMRMAALKTWSWGEEVQLEERRQLNGSYNIYMHEDLLQAVFLQYIGTQWSIFWKETFSAFRRSKGIWKSSRASISPLAQKRREYYLGPYEPDESVESKTQSIYRKSYFVSQLLNHEGQEIVGDEGDEEADFEELHMSQQAPPIAKHRKRVKQCARRSTGGSAPQMQTNLGPGRGLGKGGAFRHRKVVLPEESDDDMGEADSDDDDYEPWNPMVAKQNLLHLLSTDISIKTQLYGEITCFRTQVDNLYPSLPHTTIESVLEFFGVSKKWLQFFTRFLQAPLRFLDDPLAKPRMRKRGTPGSHVLSEVFGEVVLFCLDFAINQDTVGQPLWRLNDDIWFWSAKHATCIAAWSRIDSFTKTMGLKLNSSRTGGLRMRQDAKDSEKMVSVDVGKDLPSGQIRWGMLCLSPESGRFEIDQAMVDKHIDELNAQLQGKQGSIFAWIQTWNAYAAKFFTTNFGVPANCFGREHVENMLATHERIQRQIFSSSAGAGANIDNKSTGSVVEFLRLAIEQRFGITKIPDGYFFFPTELGGLDLQNPFIGLLQIREVVSESPRKLLEEFMDAELEAFNVAKLRFESGKTQEDHKHMHDPHFRPADPTTFFSFEEYIKYREELHYDFTNSLSDVYDKLIARPAKENVECDDSGGVKVALNALSTVPQLSLKGILSNWYSMEPYWKWVVQLYGPEMIDTFGGLSIVEPGLLPMGMVSMFRTGRVKWQE